ncbi:MULTISPECIES: T9SS type B sorting domain-containing protein [Flavobacterium]|uniref:T9SS C-terminal target domain-containing protein n=1 Tax=Flavobacterium hankyongi TaxID=1176532 RepID=A0ABP8ZS71_9FLAO|nr:T9SS type B sorting domain-containing protein [Flavobacterium sp. N1846]
MKQKLAVIFLLFTTLAYSQQEASVWYFGANAGIKFNSDNSITTLTDGQLSTSEGCATIADSNGDLLFYTDGVRVWNKNHQVMPNGLGLMGHTSSTQSATIVPKPGSPNLFYIFTLDYEVHPNGFRYSVVDINLNGGLGDVTNEKNVLVYAPSNEKISIVKHANNIDYWIVTHGFGNNTFYSHLLTSSGLSSTPVLSNVGTVVSGSTENVWGYMKISPNGSKLAICNLMQAELFDFDTASGLVTNPKTLFTTTIEGPYGAEFSPDNNILYITIPNPYKIIQYDLNATNIASSAYEIILPNIYPGALQLGPDSKIYIAQMFKTKLGVINNPNTLGAGCSVQIDAVDLNGRTCAMGLPPFVSSFFFTPVIQWDSSCENDNINFSISNVQNIISVVWDFGDGSPVQSNITTNHIYAIPNTYTVTATVTTPLGVATNTRIITISEVPTATQPLDVLQCDDDNDGFYNFDLTTLDSVILNGQNPNQFKVKYFANSIDYNNNIAIVAPLSYQNAVAYQQQSIIAEVYNIQNKACKATITFNIDVFDSPSSTTNISSLTSCDNITFGTDTDGRIRFDLTQKVTEILNGQSSIQFTIAYFTDAGLTNPIASPANYVNANSAETIYVRVSNVDNVNCFATTSFTIEVFPLPTISNVVALKQCDDNIDGFSIFNLTEANRLISANYATETFSYFETATDAQNNVNPILNFTTYANQVVSNDVVFVRVVNAKGCFKVGTLNLNVSTTQIPLNFTRNFTVCDDAVLGTNIDGISSFDFSSVTSQIQSLFPIGQQLIVTYYRNLSDALAESNAITNTANYRNIGYPNTQSIYIRVDSAVNNDCLGLGQHITLNVERIPIVEAQKYTHCDDNQDGQFAFDTSNLQITLLNGITNVSVAYLDANNNPLPSPLPNPFVTATQTIKAVVTNNTVTACDYQTTITFVVDDLPEVFPISSNLTSVCDDELDPLIQDGIFTFDTSTFQNTILGSQTGMIVNYYDQSNNSLPSPLPNPFTTATQNVRVEVINPVNATCKAIYIIPFMVCPVPRIELEGSEIVCNQLTLTKTLDAGILDGTPTTDYTYIWKKDNTLLPFEINSTLNINQEGIYTVEVKNSVGCIRTRKIKVVASDLATISNVQVTDLSDSNSIIVSVRGNGDYVYSLDNIEFQESNAFYNLPAGIYTVYVKDLNGCGISKEEVSILGIPKYFTPNGDGYNDYWNIKGIDSKVNAKTQIYIFDRFGKLLKQISPASEGWNGSFNGQSLPAADYWYFVKLEDGRDLKGHFALKR